MIHRLAKHGYARSLTVAGAISGTCLGFVLNMVASTRSTSPTISILVESLRWTLRDPDEVH